MKEAMTGALCLLIFFCPFTLIVFYVFNYYSSIMIWCMPSKCILHSLQFQHSNVILSVCVHMYARMLRLLGDIFIYLSQYKYFSFNPPDKILGAIVDMCVDNVM